MTAAQRQQVRNAIDQAARQRVDQDAIAKGCARCGCHLDNHTTGCKRCWERHRQRNRWRTDAAYRAKSNANRARQKVAA